MKKDNNSLQEAYEARGIPYTVEPPPLVFTDDAGRVLLRVEYNGQVSGRLVWRLRLEMMSIACLVFIMAHLLASMVGFL